MRGPLRAAVTVALAVLGCLLSASPGHAAPTPGDVQYFQLDGRLVTLRQSENTARLSIERAQTGDLVALTDAAGREWTAVVPPGADRAATPWVVDPVLGRARTVSGNEIVIAIQQARQGKQFVQTGMER